MLIINSTRLRWRSSASAVDSWRDHQGCPAARCNPPGPPSPRRRVRRRRHPAQLYKGAERTGDLPAGGAVSDRRAARSALLAARDPREESPRVLAVVKCNLAREAPRVHVSGSRRRWTTARVVSGGARPRIERDAWWRSPETPDLTLRAGRGQGLGLRELLGGGGQEANEVRRQSERGRARLGDDPSRGARPAVQKIKRGFGSSGPLGVASFPKMLTLLYIRWSTLGDREHLRPVPHDLHLLRQ